MRTRPWSLGSSSLVDLPTLAVWVGMTDSTQSANAVNVKITWLEGGGYTHDDIVGSLGDPTLGPVWVGMYGFGWVICTQDPATIPDGATLPDGGLFKTWGELKENEETGEACENMVAYESIQEFAAEEDTLRWMCSYQDEEKDEIEAALREHGFPLAADRIQDVDMLAAYRPPAQIYGRGRSHICHRVRKSRALTRIGGHGQLDPEFRCDDLRRAHQLLVPVSCRQPS
jgi:hypothetical protein